MLQDIFFILHVQIGWTIRSVEQMFGVQYRRQIELDARENVLNLGEKVVRILGRFLFCGDLSQIPKVKSIYVL
jgi:hypothetical protein